MEFSEEAKTCPLCTDEGFSIEDDTIRNLGKFEGEPLACYHAYHVMLDGCADDDEGPCWRVGNVICEESEQGFVYCTIFDTEAEAVAAWEADIA